MLAGSTGLGGRKEGGGGGGGRCGEVEGGGEGGRWGGGEGGGEGGRRGNREIASLICDVSAFTHLIFAVFIQDLSQKASYI